MSAAARASADWDPSTADATETGRLRGRDADGRVLDCERIGRVDPEELERPQVGVGMGLRARDVLECDDGRDGAVERCAGQDGLAPRCGRRLRRSRRALAPRPRSPLAGHSSGTVRPSATSSRKRARRSASSRSASGNSSPSQRRTRSSSTCPTSREKYSSRATGLPSRAKSSEKSSKYSSSSFEIVPFRSKQIARSRAAEAR